MWVLVFIVLLPSGQMEKRFLRGYATEQACRADLAAIHARSLPPGQVIVAADCKRKVKPER